MIGKKIDKKIMEVLKKHIGENITVKMVWFGESRTVEGILKEVEPGFITVVGSEKDRIPFKDHDIAIKRIISSDEDILYDNPGIIDPSFFYHLSDDFLPK